MITIRVIDNAQSDQEYRDFFNSLSYSHSGDGLPYEIILENISRFPVLSKELQDKICLVNQPSANSAITITISTDCLVLGNSWDKYIKYALENGLPQHGQGKNFVPTWEGYVQRRMALQSRRPPEGIFPDLKVELATK